MPATYSPRLARYLQSELQLGSQPDDVSIERIGAGNSNITYLLTIGEQRWIIRRPPLGYDSRRVRYLKREFDVLRVIHDSGVPSPEPIAFCADETLLDSPFFIMSHVDGLIVSTQQQARELGAPAARQVSRELVQTLSLLHSLDPRALADSINAPTGDFLDRQVTRWLGQARDLPGVPPAVGALADRLASMERPAQQRTAVVHGDFRLDNAIIDPTGARLRCVLDWELCSVGDPITDLALLLVYWGEPGDLEVSPEYAVTAVQGFASRSELVEWYAERSPVPADWLEFYVLLAHLKMALIVHSINLNAPATRGQSHLDLIPERLAERALSQPLV